MANSTLQRSYPFLTNTSGSYSVSGGTANWYKMCTEFASGYKIQHFYVSIPIASSEWNTWGNIVSSTNLHSTAFTWLKAFDSNPWVIGTCLNRNYWLLGPESTSATAVGTNLYLCTASKPSSTATISIHIVGFGK